MELTDWLSYAEHQARRRNIPIRVVDDPGNAEFLSTPWAIIAYPGTYEEHFRERGPFFERRRVCETTGESSSLQLLVVEQLYREEGVGSLVLKASHHLSLSFNNLDMEVLCGKNVDCTVTILRDRGYVLTCSRLDTSKNPDHKVISDEERAAVAGKFSADQWIRYLFDKYQQLLPLVK